VILKSQKRPNQDLDEADARELFETELKAYNQLRPLQGAAIPRCYGSCRYNGTDALLLERLEGVSLGSPEGATLKLEQLAELLDPCYRALHSFGVDHGDPHPGNFQLLDGKLVVLDLEQIEFDMPAEEQDLFLKLSIGNVLDRYRWLQAGFRAQGLLVAA
jgi:predicted unusual protein kinase regulating ubiquinone biosynthesis (AarF/ABC1/UbiB family)